MIGIRERWGTTTGRRSGATRPQIQMWVSSSSRTTVVTEAPGSSVAANSDGHAPLGDERGLARLAAGRKSDGTRIDDPARRPQGRHNARLKQKTNLGNKHG